DGNSPGEVADGSIRIWNVETGAEGTRFPGHNNRIDCVVFSPDGNQVLSNSTDETVRGWDVKSGREAALIPTDWFGMNVAFVPNSRKIVFVGFDGAVMWDLEARREIQRFRPRIGNIRCLAVSSDGRRLLTGSGGEMQKGPTAEPYDCTLRLWDADSGFEIRRFEGHTGPIDRVAFSPDGAFAISGSRSIQN